MVHNNKILDRTLISVGPQLDYFCYIYVYTFYLHYNIDWIANKEIGLDPRKGVMKRLRCTAIIKFHKNKSFVDMLIG